jgi:outer membrane protein TolC
MCIRVRALRGLRFLSVTTGLALTLGVAFGESPPSSPLTLEEATRLALAEQPQIAMQQALTLAAQETAVAEGQLPDPQIMLGVEDVPVNGPDAFNLTSDEMTQVVVGLAQEFPRGRTRDLRNKKATLEAEAAADGMAEALRQVRRSAALAWLDVFEREGALAKTQEIHAQSLHFAEALEIAYRAGNGSQAEVLAARIDAEQVADASASLRLEAHHMRTALARWIGAAAERPIAGGLPAMPPPGLEELLQSVERHPAIRSQDHRIEAAQAEVALGEDAYRPAWSLEVYYANRPEFSDMIGARINFDLPLFTADRQDRRQGARLALRDESRAQREDALRALRADAIESLRQWRDQSARVARYDEVILPAARLRLAATEAAYVDSRSPLASVIEARQSLLDAEVRRLELAVDAARGAVRCQYFIAPEAP